MQSENKISRLIERLFPERQFFLRSRGKVGYLRLGRNVQVAAAGLAVIAATWVGFTSVSFFVLGDWLAGKDAEISRGQAAYRELLVEIAEFHGRFDDIILSLKKNQSHLSSLVESASRRLTLQEMRTDGTQSVASKATTTRVRAVHHALNTGLRELEGALQFISGRNEALENNLGQTESRLRAVVVEHRRVQAERSELRARVGTLEGDLQQVASLLSETDMEREQATEVRDQLANNLTSLQDQMVELSDRNGALEEILGLTETELNRYITKYSRVTDDRDQLHHRVETLEGRLIGLQTNQQELLTRLTKRTVDNIAEVENMIEIADLDVDQLLKRLVDTSDQGLGGPFIPLSTHSDSADGPDDGLELQQIALDHNISRWEALQKVVRQLPITAPIDHYWVSSRFGKRRDPVNKRWSRHEGLDMVSRNRTPVMAPAPGVVVFIGWKGRYGKMIEIDHGMGVRTRYAHLRKIQVEKGQVVDFRDQIGLLGSTGRSTGPHLHYEISVDGATVDPEKFLKAGRYVFKG